jgi:hypothetical protein
MKAANSSRVTVHLPPEVMEKIQKLALDNEYKVAQLARKFLLDGLKRAEETP